MRCDAMRCDAMRCDAPAPCGGGPVGPRPIVYRCRPPAHALLRRPSPYAACRCGVGVVGMRRGRPSRPWRRADATRRAPSRRQDFQVVRTTLLPGVLKSIAHNKARHPRARAVEPPGRSSLLPEPPSAVAFALQAHACSRARRTPKARPPGAAERAGFAAGAAPRPWGGRGQQPGKARPGQARPGQAACRPARPGKAAEVGERKLPKLPKRPLTPEPFRSVAEWAVGTD
jgi:hypothetical protein